MQDIIFPLSTVNLKKNPKGWKALQLKVVI